MKQVTFNLPSGEYVLMWEDGEIIVEKTGGEDSWTTNISNLHIIAEKFRELCEDEP